MQTCFHCTVLTQDTPSITIHSPMYHYVMRQYPLLQQYESEKINLTRCTLVLGISNFAVQRVYAIEMDHTLQLIIINKIPSYKILSKSK